MKWERLLVSHVQGFEEEIWGHHLFGLPSPVPNREVAETPHLLAENLFSLRLPLELVKVLRSAESPLVEVTDDLTMLGNDGYLEG